MVDDSSRLQPGSVIGDGYVIERWLGGGGMGHVYQARDPRLDRLVAIKLLHAEVAASEEAEARFRREARALSRVLHPNVVGIHAFGRHANAWYLVMEYVEGKSLEQLLAQGRLPVATALELTRQVAAGLAEAHALGIVHRDIKPGNVLVRTLASGDLLAKVADFGLARSSDDRATAVVTSKLAILGTPAYMAPEQIQAQPIDGRTDLYALAAMLYHQLTGSLPYPRDSLQATLIAHLIEPPPALPPELSREVPAGLESELLKALAKKPQDRHASVTAFSAALAGLSGAKPAALAVTVECPGCAAEATPGGFCSQCGTAVPVAFCGICGTPRNGERYSCEGCGSSLLYWPSSAATLVAGLRESAAAVLVARLPAGDVQDLADWAAGFATAVAREGGRTLALVGSEAIAVFGLGGMRDGDAMRAVDAALALTAEAPARGGAIYAAVEVGAVASRGTGLAWGLAMLGGAAVEAARTAAAQARAAAEASSSAGGNTVVIGEQAYRELRGLFEIRLVAHPPIRQVLRRRDASLALADYMSREVARPLVGRAAELSLCLRACRKARRDHGLVVLATIGPAEVGNSRLAGEVLRRLEESGEPWRLELVRASPLELPSGWQPFAELVRDAALGDDHHLDLRLSRLPGLDDGDPERGQRRVQALMRMLGLGQSEDGQAPRPASDAELAAAFEAWAALVRGLCASQPVVLVAEDLQYARPVMLSLIAHIARSCEELPLCLVLPLRQESADGVLQALQLPAERTIRVAVAPLEAEDTEELTEELLGSMPAPAGLAEALHRYAEGLPGRVEQAVDTLIDEGVLQLSDDGWRLSDPAALAAMLKRSLGELLLRRVGRLAPADRAVLEAVAIAGGSAPQGMAAALLQREPLPAELERLRQGGLLAESRSQPFAGQREWILRPDALGPLLLQAMPRSARTPLHRRAAVWLEDWSGSRPATYAARLANHHLQAGDTPDALRQLLANAQACVRAYATRDGYEGYGTAAELAQRWLDSGALQARVPLVQALVGRAETGLRVGELATALRMAQRAAALATPPDNSPSDQAQMDDLRVRARCLAGQILDSQGQPDEALAVLGQAVEDARIQPQGYGSSVYAISLIAMVLLRTGRLGDAEALARQALLESQDRSLQGDSQFAAGVGRLHTWLGHALARRGDHSQAQQQYLMGLAAFRQGGDEFAAVMTELSLGNLAWRAHRLEDAEQAFRQVWLRCQAQDEVLGAATAQANLGQVLLDRGKPAEALDMLAESERSQRRIGRLEVLAETLRLQGLALHALGRLEEARAAVAKAVAHAEKTGQSALMAAAKETMTGLK